MGIKIISAMVAGCIMGAAATYYATVIQPVPDSVLFLDGKKYSVEDLPPAAAQAIYDIELNAWVQKKQILTGTAGELYLQIEMAKTGKDRSTVIAELFDVELPTDDDLKAFYDERKADLSDASYEQVKDQIRSYLMGMSIQHKRNEILEKLTQDAGLALLLPEPEAPLNVINHEGFPVKGNAKAKTTIVKFADYQCPHCQDAAATLNAFVEEYVDDVKLVYIDFPVNHSGISRTVALGAVCADEQGKYWEYNNAAYKQQSTLNDESHIDLADILSLDKEVFAQCMASDRPETRVAKGEAEAERLGLTGTPAIFVNGKAVRPTDLHDGLKTAIKKIAQL